MSNHREPLITRRAPQWAWDIIDETLACDANSTAFDANLRTDIERAIDALDDAPPPGEDQ